MRLTELFKIAIMSIRGNKIRSLLTMLGLIIGISSVVTILSIGEGTSNSISSNLGSLGVNNVVISESKDETILPNERIIISDYEKLKGAFPDKIGQITPQISRIAEIRENIDSSKVTLIGAVADTQLIGDLELVEGRFITQQDTLTRKNVIVIDSDIKKELVGEGVAVGKSLAVRSGKSTNSYVIVGVYLKESSSMGVSSNDIYLPYTTLDKQLNLKGRLDAIKIAFLSSDHIESDGSQVVAYLERIHHNENKGKYEYFSMGSMISTVTDTLGMVTLLISAVAGISLVVGGIGVMNIMLVSVTERTREIGVRKALGAKRKDILLQFLVEAVIICLIGGALGIGFGFIFTKLAEMLFATPMKISLYSVLLSTIFSSAMGIIFGVYPANKASKLDPIESLRYE